MKNQKTSKDTAARTKENMLRQIVSLFNFARRQKYVSAELALELSEISTPKKQPSPIGIYSPAEMSAILVAADAEVIPALAIAAFAGLRLAEVLRIDWRDVRMSEKLIVVGAEHSKTAARRLVPMTKNLIAWLTPHSLSRLVHLYEVTDRHSKAVELAHLSSQAASVDVEAERALRQDLAD